MRSECSLLPSGLEPIGLTNLCNAIWNANTPMLYEEIVRRREGYISHLGPIVVRTGSHTGRSPNDKFVVRDQASEDKVWWGTHNRPITPEKFTLLYHRLQAYLQGKDVFVQDCHAGADPVYRLPIRVITEQAWHSLFARNMFRRTETACPGVHRHSSAAFSRHPGNRRY